MALAFIFGFLGGALGWVVGGMLAALAGAAIGGGVGWMMTAASRRASPSMPLYGIRREPAGAASGEAVLARLATVEERLARLEARVGVGMAARETPADVAGFPAAVGAPTGQETRSADEADFRTPTPIAVPVDLPAAPPPRGAASAPAHPRAQQAAANRAWTWFTGGNTLTRIGVVVLFFGVAFLLRWFAERFTIALEWRLAAVAIAALALLAAGLRIARTRPPYGLALQGAGAGILYLTTFAAFRLYDVIPAVPAFALLVVVSTGSVALALRSASQAMAALAFAGGFLAPVLVAPGGSEPLPLFGYLALLNTGVFLIASRRAWRALNALGFLFTFALALVWGFQFYAPRFFAVVEPFLALFFAFYVVIAILEAVRTDVNLARPVDALLVFGVPATAFALQHGLVREFEYGQAWTAAGLAAIYGVLALALGRRRDPGLTLLARAFLVIAVVFASLAIPFAVDARHTAAWWSLEAAGAYWLGCRQRQPAVRGLSLLLQIGAALFLLAAGPYPGAHAPFANAGFMGTALVGVAALATIFVADRQPEVLGAAERALVPWIFAWGVGWWIGAAHGELAQRVSVDDRSHAVLAWVAGSALVARVLQRALDWPRIALLGLALLPAMALVASEDLDREHTTLLAYGTIVWPVAWIAHWATLAGLDRARRARAVTVSAMGDQVVRLHAASVVLLVAHLSWEAGEWAGRWSPEGTSWITAASAVPAIVVLAIVTIARDVVRWPLATHREAYVVTAGTVVAALLAAWFVLANILSPGDPDPLPYIPLANPLDFVLVVALAVSWTWAARCTTFDERTRYVLLGIALFIALNGVVVRTVHHWLDVPWRADALGASKPLQAALTLTWTATALPLMFLATRRRLRPLWMVGAALLALVVVKLFALDLAALSGLSRVVAFLGVGGLLLVIGYVSPLPPAAAGDEGAPRPDAPAS